MNSIQKINSINQKELDSNVTDSASWHADYRDTPYIYIGFLPQELSEPDILAIFSQYGIPTHINLIKDKESGKSKGFCYLKYEDYRSCVLAIDNFNGISVLDKKLKVDHVYFQLKDGQNEDDFIVDYRDAKKQAKEKKQVEGKEKKLLTYADSKNNGHGALASLSKADGSDESKDPIDEFKDPIEDFKDPMEEYMRDRKRHKSSKSSGSKSSSHRTSSSQSSTRRSSSHGSSSRGSSSHRSSSHRSSSHRSSSHGSSSHGSSLHSKSKDSENN
ncbi:putative U2 snRNP component ist3 [[Candida] railenensis]|uniref:U2 snRNP component ist3 n=1 Tax=[Candida] railenensis TaxID=45579 RepID=A0A9P0VY28_9ASCO|nr:putative U2 snRNP component ist3 [[Candida] railenensis]